MMDPNDLERHDQLQDTKDYEDAQEIHNHTDQDIKN